MRHRKLGGKLNRTSSHRKAMFRNMVTSLFKYDSIKTTDVKAKLLRTWADHLVTLAKRGDLHARRQAMSIVREKEVVHKLFAEAGERYGDISGGYTRIVKVGRRQGDAAPVSIIALLKPEDIKVKKTSGKTTTIPAAAVTKATETKPAQAAPEPPAGETEEIAAASTTEAHEVSEDVAAESADPGEDAVTATPVGAETPDPEKGPDGSPDEPAKKPNAE